VARLGSGASALLHEDKIRLEEEVRFKHAVQWGGFFIWLWGASDGL
jgi:hypothetical protein